MNISLAGGRPPQKRQDTFIKDFTITESGESLSQRSLSNVLNAVDTVPYGTNNWPVVGWPCFSTKPMDGAQTNLNYVWNARNPFLRFHGARGAISARGGLGNAGHNGTLIAPRLVVAANHCWESPATYQPGRGAGTASWIFVGRNNDAHFVTAEWSVIISNAPTGNRPARPTDYRLFLLKEAVPDTVDIPYVLDTPLRNLMTSNVFPSLMAHASWQIDDDARLPLIYELSPKSKQWSLHQRMWTGTTWEGTEHYLPPQAKSVVPTNWWLKTIAGDSGSGRFSLVDTNFVWAGINWSVLDVDSMHSNLMYQAEWLCTNFGHEYVAPKALRVGPIK